MPSRLAQAVAKALFWLLLHMAVEEGGKMEDQMLGGWPQRCARQVITWQALEALERLCLAREAAAEWNSILVELIQELF